MTKFRQNNWRGVSRDSYFVTLGTDEGQIEKMISLDYVFCYVPRSLDILWKYLTILEFIKEEAVASLISVAAPMTMWIWIIFRKSGKFWVSFENFEILENYMF